MGVPAIQGLYRPGGFKLQLCCGFLELAQGKKCGLTLIRSFVIAGGTAGLAVHQPVLADANIECCLAETTKFVALATVFRHLALCATEFDAAASGGHSSNVALQRAFRKRAISNPKSIYNS